MVVVAVLDTIVVLGFRLPLLTPAPVLLELLEIVDILKPPKIIRITRIFLSAEIG